MCEEDSDLNFSTVASLCPWTTHSIKSTSLVIHSPSSLPQLFRALGAERGGWLGVSMKPKVQSKLETLYQPENGPFELSSFL